jgi:hypothetical protein
MLGQGVSPYLATSSRGLTLDVNYVESTQLYDQATAIDSNGKQEGWLIYTLTGFYALSDRWSVLASAPYVSKTNIDTTGTLTSAIGDMALLGRYTAFLDHTLTSTTVGAFLGGIKFPTGSTSNVNAQGQPIDRHALPGTGSFDLRLGFSGNYTAPSGFQLTADLLFGYSGPGSWAGRFHRYGNSFNGAVRGFYRINSSEQVGSQPGSSSVLPFLGLSGEWTGQETGVQTDQGYVADAKNLSSGGTVLYAEAGTHLTLGTSALAGLGVAKAFYHNMNYNPAFDADPAESYKLDVSLTYLF